MSDARVRQVPQPQFESGRSSLLLKIPTAAAVVLLSVGVLYAHGVEVPERFVSSRIIQQTPPAPPAIKPLRAVEQPLLDVGKSQLVVVAFAELTQRGKLAGITREPFGDGLSHLIRVTAVPPVVAPTISVLHPIEQDIAAVGSPRVLLATTELVSSLTLRGVLQDPLIVTLPSIKFVLTVAPIVQTPGLTPLHALDYPDIDVGQPRVLFKVTPELRSVRVLRGIRRVPVEILPSQIFEFVAPLIPQFPSIKSLRGFEQPIEIIYASQTWLANISAGAPSVTTRQQRRNWYRSSSG